MDVAAVAAQGGIMPAVGTGSDAMETGGISFGDVMAQMAAGGSESVMTQGAATNGMSWRDMQALMSSASVGVQTAALAGGETDQTAEELLEAIIRMILEGNPTDEAGLFGNIAEKTGGKDLLELIAKLQKKLQSADGEPGELDANSQMMAMLNQLALLGGAGSEQTLFDQMATADPENMQQMIEVLPKEALQALMTTAAFDARTTATGLLAQFEANAQPANGAAAASPQTAETEAEAQTQAQPVGTQAAETQAAQTQAAQTPNAASAQAQQSLAEGTQPAFQQAAAQAAGTTQTAAPANPATANEAAMNPQAEIVPPAAAPNDRQTPQGDANATAQNGQPAQQPAVQTIARPDAAQTFAEAAAETNAKAEAPAQQPATEPASPTASEAQPKADAKPAEAAEAKDQRKPTLEELQQQADAGVHLRGTNYAANVSAQNRVQQAVPVYTQVETQIRQAVKAGADEFTMKLAPEGLGDITVHLSKVADGTISLGIVTKGAEAQQLLSQQIDQLKTALGELKVRVEPVITEQQANLLAQQQDMSQNQARREHTDLRGAAYHRDEPLGAEAVEEAAPAQTAAPDQLLNTYI